jgi:hypothetical protein
MPAKEVGLRQLGANSLAKKSQKLNCFFVTPIGKIGSPERLRADNILKHVLRGALQDTFQIIRADEIDDPGTISGDIIVRLYNSDLVVADLTGTNPNVMYEVGIRHSFSRPIVQICQSGQALPFDLADERTIFFDLSSLDEIAEAKEKIERAARRALDARPFRSPVVRALELDTLFSDAEATPLSKSLVEKLEELGLSIEEVQSDIGSLENSIAHMSMTVDSPDGRTLEEVAKIARMFDYVGPSEIAELVRTIRELKSGRA